MVKLQRLKINGREIVKKFRILKHEGQEYVLSEESNDEAKPAIAEQNKLFHTDTDKTITIQDDGTFGLDKGDVVYPLESKNFLETEITIPVPVLGDTQIPVYIYLGKEGQILDAKGIYAIVSNFLRQSAKKPNFTDLVRGTIITKNPDDYQYVKNYFLDNCKCDDENGSSFDSIEERKASLFPPHSREVIPCYADITTASDRAAIELRKKGESPPEESDEDFEDKTALKFEMQVVANIDDFLCYSASHYTASSHRKFRAKREASIVDQLLHPPAIYGVRALKAREKIPPLRANKKVYEFPEDNPAA